MNRLTILVVAAVGLAALATGARAERAAAPPLACKAVTTGKLQITLLAGFKGSEAAALYHSYTCRTVVMSSAAAQRRSRQGFRKTVAPAGIDRAMTAIARQLQLVPYRSGNTIYLLEVDRDGFAQMPSVDDRVTVASDPADRADADAEVTAAELDAAIHVVSNTEYEIDSAFVDQFLANPAALISGARVVPAMRDGVSDGFKIYAVRPGSLYARLGIKNGDTLLKLNGIVLDSPDTVLEAYEKAAASRRAVLELRRRGKAITLTWTAR